MEAVVEAETSGERLCDGLTDWLTEIVTVIFGDAECNIVIEADSENVESPEADAIEALWLTL